MKKRLLFLLLLLAARPGLAQTVEGGNPTGTPDAPLYTCRETISRRQRTADSLLQHLDKSQVPTQVLYDRVPGLAALDVFNRVYNDADTSDVHHYLQAYYELHAADYRNPGTAPCRQVLADHAASARQRGTVLLGALRYRFNYIDSNAVRHNQLRWDTSAPSQLYDVPGRNGSPYLLAEVAVAAALADSSRSGTVTFRLDPACVFTNTGTTLSSATIDFGNGGGAQTCLPGQTIVVSYGTAGNKVLRYVLTYSDGNQFTTCSSLYVPRAAVFNRGPNFIDPCRTELMTANIPFMGAAGQAQVSYYYSTNPLKNCSNNAAQLINKPVVIVDGIDYAGDREGGDIFGEYLSYNEGGQTRNLGRQLQDQGYDVVILDFPNLTRSVRIGNYTYNIITRHSGADYMERNAYTLVKLIQRLNQQLQAAGSTEQIVIVGPSMGGQITRYALAYMEANQLAHNTRLFVSLDSPNNGATIPIGLQHFVSFFAGESNSQDLVDGLGLLDSPASRELTLQHHSQAPFPFGPTPYRPDPMRTSFLNSLSALGSYPNQLRRVAVADGALDATPQHDQHGQVIHAGDQAFLLEQRGVPPGAAGTVVRLDFPIGLLGRLVTTAKGRVYYGPNNGQTARVLDAYTISAGTHNRNAVGVPNSCSLDGASGGYRNFLGFAKSDATGGLFAHAFSKRNFYSVRDRSCFIPTLSALGVSQPADNCQPAGQNLVCSGATPFDAYYGPVGFNDEHLHLTAANVAFMRNEILNITPAPEFTAAPTALCPTGGTATFTVNALCSRTNAAGQPLYPTTYDWTLSGPAVFAGTPTSTQTLTNSGSSQGIITTAASGTVTLTVVARRAGAAASAPVTRTVVVTDGSLVLSDLPVGQRTAVPQVVAKPIGESGSTNFTCSRTLDLTATGRNVRAPYSLRITTYRPTGPSVRTYSVNDGPFQVTVYDNSIDIELSATSTCTGALITSGYLTADGCSAQRAAAAYPNPADAVLHLAAPETEGAAAGAPVARTAVLYNAQGRAVRRSLAPAALALPTAELPAGLYYLVVEQGGRATRSQIRVQH